MDTMVVRPEKEWSRPELCALPPTSEEMAGRSMFLVGPISSTLCKTSLNFQYGCLPLSGGRHTTMAAAPRHRGDDCVPELTSREHNG